MDGTDYIHINWIQHFTFCKRQWALIVLEQLWEENEHTRIGQYTHALVDDPYFREKRSGRIITRSVPLISHALEVRGVADVIEYHQAKQGIQLEAYEGLWFPTVVEYKKGKPKKDHRDIVQLVLQVMCLEEMTGLQIEEGYLYYKQPNKRIQVTITDNLREEVKELLDQMKGYIERKETPAAEEHKNCQKCSLVNQCMPRWTKRGRNVENYLNKYLGD